MPSVKICIWNIQNYGSRSMARKWEDDSNLRNRFIRAFVRQQQIDVLLIMEVSGRGESSLRNLMSCLNLRLAQGNRDWAMSFCGSSLIADKPNPPTSEKDLSFRTDGRSEGYAVFWRTNRTDRFRVLSGLHPIAVPRYANDNPAPPARTPLNLSTFGRPAGVVKGLTPKDDEWRALGGYTQESAYPCGADGKPLGGWSDLLLPTTSSRNPRPLRLQKARRPAYVVLELVRNADPRGRLCPVAAYHAPSNRARAEWGALQSGLARELYATNDLKNQDPNPKKLVTCNRSVFGGDFNYGVATGDWPGEYLYFVNDHDTGPEGGSQSEVAPASALPEEARCTTVQLFKDDHKTPIKSDKLVDYLRYKIDLAFFPGGGNNGKVVNVPELLMTPATRVEYKKVLEDFHKHLNEVALNIVKPKQRLNLDGRGPEEKRKVVVKKKSEEQWVAMLCGSWGASFLNWKTFMNQLQKGELTDARRAAEFFNIFISDHLPLVVELKFT